MRSIIFRGMEGANPLGFLAALGAFRLFDLMWREQRIRLRWVREGGWRPEVSGLPTEDETELCELLSAPGPWAALDAFSELGNNLTVARPLFERVVGKTAAEATGIDRRAADFVAAFGSDVFEDKEKDRIDYTDLCFITGSGHQHFLGTVKSLAGAVGPEHLREALFGPWRYADKGLSMRWDPDDAREYALRWRDPSVGGVSSVWGASLLAFEALPLFPTVPTVKGLRTTGFRTQKRAHELTWPIWTQPASVDTVRSLLSLIQLEQEAPARAELQPMGIDEVFRVQRVRIGQGANFKVSFRPARSV
ncbi:MAG: hypothetical protein NTY38_32780 [Acidobacteria bacterium]|nr:hypothetical protein [Acidobacteriota bacterium]